jgi:hypothetical protein
MELPESHKREREETEESILSISQRLKASEHSQLEIGSSFEKLPRELIGYIATFLTSAASPGQAISDIKSFLYVNKSASTFFSDLHTTKNIIYLVSKRFNKELLDIVLLLRTKGAMLWFHSYLAYLNEQTEDEQSEKEFSKIVSEIVHLIGKDSSVVTFLRNILHIQYLMFKAIEEGNVEAVDALIKAGAD